MSSLYGLLIMFNVKFHYGWSAPGGFPCSRFFCATAVASNVFLRWTQRNPLDRVFIAFADFCGGVWPASAAAKSVTASETIWNSVSKNWKSKGTRTTPCELNYIHLGKKLLSSTWKSILPWPMNLPTSRPNWLHFKLSWYYPCSFKFSAIYFFRNEFQPVITSSAFIHFLKLRFPKKSEAKGIECHPIESFGILLVLRLGWKYFLHDCSSHYFNIFLV